MNTGAGLSECTGNTIQLASEAAAHAENSKARKKGVWFRVTEQYHGTIGTILSHGNPPDFDGIEKYIRFKIIYERDVKKLNDFCKSYFSCCVENNRPMPGFEIEFDNLLMLSKFSGVNTEAGEKFWNNCHFEQTRSAGEVRVTDNQRKIVATIQRKIVATILADLTTDFESDEVKKILKGFDNDKHHELSEFLKRFISFCVDNKSHFLGFKITLEEDLMLNEFSGINTDIADYYWSSFKL